MTARQKELLDRLFEQAVALSPDRQRDLVREHGDDPEVQAELESLLAFDAGHPPTGVIEAIEQTAESLAGASLVGQRVGPYRLLARIGQGGMGTVCRAVRADDQFQQTVAIKLLRFARGEPFELQRFRRERQILASLEHPYIARLLDGGAWVAPGSTESQPYIVMEYVEGLSLIAHCEEKKLGLCQRLLLFRQICDALSYAHRRFIVHRDIKPGNILVTADGIPKLLDFGVAKLLAGESNSDVTPSTQTVNGKNAMTPDYASPEQFRGAPVSTVTDVYSLGAVLYEMLTGRRAHQLLSRDPAQIAIEICDRDIQPPSAVGGRELRGDLDVIVMKAMQKEPARRYQSVEQFSEDVRRYLEGLPIDARPDALAYRAGKFVRRHRLSLAAAGAVFVALVGGIGVSVREAVTANNERNRAVSEKQRADRESATAKAVNEFLQKDLLAQASTSAQGLGNKPDPDLKVRVALDRAAARIAGKFNAQPQVEASIRQTIGTVYHDLGLFRESQQQLEHALALRRRTLGEEHPDVFSSMTSLALLYIDQGKYPPARSLLTRLLELQRRVLGPEHPDTLGTLSDLGLLYSYEGDDSKSELLLLEALNGRKRTLGPEHPETLDTMSTLGVEYRIEGKYSLAEPLLTKAVSARERLIGPDHPDTLTSQTDLAGLYLIQGKYALAEALYTKSIKNSSRVLGAEHPNTLMAMRGLESVYEAERKFAAAETLQTNVLNLQRRVLGREHPDTLFAETALASIYRKQGKYPQAELLLTTVVEVRRRVLGAQHRDTSAALAALGRIRVLQGNYAGAEPLLREACNNYEKSGLENWRRYYAQNLLGASLAGQRKYIEAEPLTVKGYEGMLRLQSSIAADDRSVLEQGREWVIQLYQNWGNPRKAAEWRRKILEEGVPAPVKPSAH